MKSSLFLLFILTTILFSCKKESNLSGNGSLVYRSENQYPHKIKPVGLTDRLILENTYPYTDILGQIMISLSESTTNGKPTKFSDIQVPNINLTMASIFVSSENAFVGEHLTDSKIVYKYYSPYIPGTIIEKTIATFSHFDNFRIHYTLVSENLAEAFKADPYGSFYMDFDFDSDAVSDEITISYDLAFDYDYKMKQYSK